MPARLLILDSDFKSESGKVVLFYICDLTRIYWLLGRLVLEANNGLVSTMGFHEINLYVLLAVPMDRAILLYLRWISIVL